jgi:uncharacterized protein (UPF0548 family)
VLRPGTESKRSVLLLSKPTSRQVESFLIAQRTEEFSYSEQGASRQQAPAGFTVDHNRIQLGEGVEDFNRAKRAIDAWKMFDLTWVNLSPSQGPIHRGANVAVVVSHLGFWSMNAARIVYVIDERGSSQTYGFAYGTLRDHGERGEERFTVEFHSDQTVWYDLYAFSRPSPLARLAYPYTRHLQRRFATDSKAAMLKAVRSKQPL